MTTTKKLLIGLCVLVIGAGALFGGRWGIDRYRDGQKEAELNVTVQKLLDKSGAAQLANFDERLNAVRTFVYDNSTHSINKEFYTRWKDHKALADEVLKYSEGGRDTQPPMECSTRANLMAQMLKLMDYRTRNIVLYNPEDSLEGHRIIEVQNPETGEWVAEDPDYDMYWRHAETKERASLYEVAMAPDAHEPCGREKCGWDHRNKQGSRAEKLRDYIKIQTLHDKHTNMRVTLYAQGVDPARIYNFEDGRVGTFCEIMDKQCQQKFMPMSEFKEENGWLTF